MTKHRVLIEFESDHLPDDFTDQVAGRVYMMPCVNKVECTATLVGDIAKDAERYNFIREVPYRPEIQEIMALQKNALMDTAIDAAMKGQP